MQSLLTQVRRIFFGFRFAGEGLGTLGLLYGEPMSDVPGTHYLGADLNYPDGNIALLIG